MQGEFIEVWSETYREIWEPLLSQEIVPDDIYCELYRELSKALKNRNTIEELANIIGNVEHSKKAFLNIKIEDLSGERALITSFEKLYESLDELVGDALANPYFNLIETFIDKFNLRYDLRRPFTLCPTLPGVFSSLVLDLRMVTSKDAHLDSLMKDFEESIRDLTYGCTDGRIRICIGKQAMLLEALGSTYRGANKQSFGDACDQIKTWPHLGIRESLKKLYGFTSDYPGIRHGTNTKGVLRTIDMRDMVAMSILLAGFTPYLTDQLNADNLYWRI